MKFLPARGRASLMLFLLSAIPTLIFGQCGTDPASGTTTINSAGSIPNSYYPGTGNPNAGANSVSVGTKDARGNAANIAVGSLILIIQMQGADINSANTTSYGSGVAGGNGSGYLATNLYAGDYEFNSVTSITGGGSNINLATRLVNNYRTRNYGGTNGVRAFQVIVVPRNYNLSITAAGSITAPQWNGKTGGVIVLNAANIMTINGTINANAKGFRGGGGKNFTGATAGSGLTNTDYRWDSPATTAANLSGGAKGEGIAGTPLYYLNSGSATTSANTTEGYVNGSMGRGAPANGGGGGTDGAPVGSAQNQYNTGGGGGANGGNGGRGGSGWHGGSGNSSTYPYGGYGGTAYAQSSITEVIMGGGGGAGTANNSSATEEYQSSGGSGGGIIILRAKSYAGNGTVDASGGDGETVDLGPNTDASGGGGAGGSIIAVTSATGAAGLNLITAIAAGGNGGNMETYYDHGPGGGGGGGIIFASGAFASVNVAGGSNGFTRTGSTIGPINNSFGSTSGTAGHVTNLNSHTVLVNSVGTVSACGILPVQLSSFAATYRNGEVVLEWQADHAVSFDRFQVEYSQDGRDFDYVGEVDYEYGKSVYRFYHTPLQSGKGYYRLKMIDNTNGYTYSKILQVYFNGVNGAMVKLFPQPADKKFNISLQSATDQRVTVSLYGVTGVKADEQTFNLRKGSNLLEISNARLLQTGMYIIKMAGKEFQYRSTLLIQHK